VASALIRCALVATALLAGAWLVLGFRASELEADADTVIAKAQFGEATADEVQHGQGLLGRARLLSVDNAPLLSEGLLLFAHGQREEGLAIVEDVVEREPANLGGWIALYSLYSTNREPKRAAKAARMARALNPLAGDALER
jgi:hypothetical protein